ncbi:MAG: tetrahydromethanopterin S-methyltransferase subunit G [Methanosarcinaceae archaeon]|jgi:tetrahydromethanopterin S-methyltransferase subunit G|nr:tetrahydromethanopterin S-methyltransferase subunit G [Methanosarcinaceae archaeon]
MSSGNNNEADRYNEVMDRLDRIDEKISFVSTETAQRYGRQTGRDIGILYGMVAALLIAFAYLLLRTGPF